MPYLGAQIISNAFNSAFDQLDSNLKEKSKRDREEKEVRDSFKTILANQFGEDPAALDHKSTGELKGLALASAAKYAEKEKAIEQARQAKNDAIRNAFIEAQTGQLVDSRDRRSLQDVTDQSVLANLGALAGQENAPLAPISVLDQISQSIGKASGQTGTSPSEDVLRYLDAKVRYSTPRTGASERPFVVDGALIGPSGNVIYPGKDKPKEDKSLSDVRPELLKDWKDDELLSEAGRLKRDIDAEVFNVERGGSAPLLVGTKRLQAQNQFNAIQKELANRKPQDANVPKVVRVISPDGKKGVVPESQIDDALKQGYKRE